MNGALVIPMSLLAVVGLIEFILRFLLVLIIVCSMFGLMILSIDSNDLMGDLRKFLNPQTFELIRDLSK